MAKKKPVTVREAILAKYPNLTNVAQGQPKKGFEKAQVNLPPEVWGRTKATATAIGWKYNEFVEEALRIALGMPSEYSLEDLQSLIRAKTVEPSSRFRRTRGEKA